MDTILLQGGTLLLHDAADDTIVRARRADLLITGKHITQIADAIAPPSPQTKILDCRGKLVSPGFIDTHRHLWQTQLKGRHADEVLRQYIVTGNLTGRFFHPRDVFWGTLAGALESVDAGTTTVVDHAHVVYSPAHARAALAATRASGIRSLFCLVPTRRVRSLGSTLDVDPEMLPAWFDALLDELAAELPLDEGRVELGFGFDAFGLEEGVIRELYGRVRRLGVNVITSHHLDWAIGFNSIDPLHAMGLLGPDILIAHASQLTAAQAQQLLAAGAHISATPSTELQMALGKPVCFAPALTHICSLGVDCHSAAAGDMAGQMRLAVQAERGMRHQALLERSSPPPSISETHVPAELTARAVFNLATIRGAQAIGRADRLGSLAVGKLADVVVWDAGSPGMVCAGAQDPVAAIVLHSSVRDVEAVVVGGVVRKEGGVLVPVRVGGGMDGEEGRALDGEEREERWMSWKEIAREVLRSRERIQGLTEGVDAEGIARAMFG